MGNQIGTLVVSPEAQTPGSSYAAAGVASRPRNANVGGLVIPFDLPDLVPVSMEFGRTIQRNTPSVMTRAPRGSDGRGGNYGASIQLPHTALGPSVAGTIAKATNIQNIVDVAKDIPNAGKRPLLPPGLRARAAEAMPPGMRTRAAAWARNVERFAAKRSARVPVSRES